MTKLPEKPRSHEVDDLTVAAFFYQRPAGWVVNEHHRDYGRDLHVTVSKEPGYIAGDDFWVQLKGSDSPDYLADGIHLSHELRVETLNQLCSLSSPVMLAVCDVSKTDRPIFWVWIEEALKELEQRNPNWRAQASVSIRVPLKNILGAKTQSIEEQVKTWHFDRHINETIAGFVRPATAIPSAGEVAAYTDTTVYVQQCVVPRLRDAGLVEVEQSGEATTYTPEQRDFREKLKEIGALLDKYRDEDAKSLLGKIESNASAATPRLRAAYHNSRGVLAIHESEHEHALAEFSIATSLNQEEVRIATNLLGVEYTLSQENTSVRPLPEDWEDRLDRVLEKNSGFLPAIKLRMRRLAESDGVEAATEFAREHSVSEGERREVLTALAEIHLFEGRPRQALEILSEGEPPNAGQEAWFFALKGQALFAAAVPSARPIGDGRMLLQGMGPRDLNLSLLEEACIATEKALSHASEQTPRHVVEEIAGNAAMARLLRGENEKAITVTKNFLQRFPESRRLNGVLANAYFLSGQSEKGIDYARKAQRPDDATGETYRNLVLMLMAAERFDEALEEIGAREKQGFRDKDEEHLSYQLAAIAHAENSNFERANKCIEKLRADPASAANATLAEVEVRRREGKAPAELQSLIRIQLVNDPKNPWLLTGLVRELGWPNTENAEEIVDAVKRIAESRQLTQVEFAALGHGYLQLNELDDAERVFRSAIERYPEDSRFGFEYAQVLALGGNEDGAYHELHRYLKFAKGDPHVYRNLGSLAFSTGHIEEAIKWLGRALSRTTDPKERGELNHLLWELCRRRGDPAKELMRYVTGFGQTTDDDADAEARFLMMALLTPLAPEDLEHSEIAASRDEINRRLDAFVEAHPQHRGFRAFKMPLNLSDEEQAQRLMQELAYITLPRRLAAGQMEIAARGAPWPLCLRAPLLHNSNSLFSYWEVCTNSGDYTNAVHIFYAPLDIDAEASEVPLDQRVVVDLNALLTLCALKLLDEIPKVFRQIILARSTRQAIWRELGQVGYSHPLAWTLEDWITRNGAVIRIRAAKDDLKDETQKVVGEMLGYGIGESFALAEQLGLALYSDEGVVRAEAKKKGSPDAFCTISLLRRLRQADRLRLDDETKLLGRLMRLNYRYVPFGAEHLQSALMSAVGRSITAETLRSDETVRSFLDQFGETHVTLESLLKVVGEWWPKLLANQAVSDDLIERVIGWIIFVATQRLMVADKIPACWDLDDVRSEILVALLMAVKRSRVFDRGVGILKHCAEEIARNSETRYRKILFEKMPDTVVRSLMQSGQGRAEIERVTSELMSALPQEERAKWEERLVTVHRLRPR